MVGLLIWGVMSGGEFGNFKSEAGKGWCLSLEAMGGARGRNKDFLNGGAKIGGGAIIRLVKESEKTMEGRDITGFDLGLPNVESIFPLDNNDGDDDGGGIKGTDGLFISMGTGGGAIGKWSFWGGGGGGGAMRPLSFGSPEWGATAIMGRLDSGPHSVVR